MTKNKSPNETPLEASADYLVLAYTNTDLTDDGQFQAWFDRNVADIVAVPGYQGFERFRVDPDQRRGQVPSWSHLVLLGFGADTPELRAALDVASAQSNDAELVAWAYAPAGDFVRQSDGLPGSRGKTEGLLGRREKRAASEEHE
ncbi:MAG TPA: hypothetical protein VGC45_00165 [Gryllotalpicola sp.]